MAPSVLRDLSPSSFNPRLVSIGPLHREDENVKAFEGQKVSYLINLMSYINSPQEEILESCMQKAYCVMNEIKGCYIWTKTFTDAEIAEMMVLDACFIIGFIIDEHVSYHKKTYVEKQLQYRTIMNDMVLLENQIPLFFLDQMFQCTVLKFNSNVSFIELIKPVLNSHKLFQADLKFNNISFGTNDHFLSLLHQCYMPPARVHIKMGNGYLIHVPEWDTGLRSTPKTDISCLFPAIRSGVASTPELGHVLHHDHGVLHPSRLDWKGRKKKMIRLRWGNRYGPAHKCPEEKILGARHDQWFTPKS
ncbi:hypothetical protein R6Q59_026836 [Mikania micrantha]